MFTDKNAMTADGHFLCQVRNPADLKLALHKFRSTLHVQGRSLKFADSLDPSENVVLFAIAHSCLSAHQQATTAVYHKTFHPSNDYRQRSCFA